MVWGFEHKIYTKKNNIQKTIKTQKSTFRGFWFLKPKSLKNIVSTSAGNAFHADDDVDDDDDEDMKWIIMQ